MRTSDGATRKADVLILTPKEIEFAAVSRELGYGEDWQDPVSHYTFSFTQVNAIDGALRVAVMKSGKGYEPTPDSVRAGIAALRPEIIILFGTAAGLKDTKVGDILIGSEGRHIGQSKFAEGKTSLRPNNQFASHRLVEFAEMLARRKKEWLSRMPDRTEPSPEIHSGPIVSSDAVIATDSVYLKKVIEEQHYGAVGYEMEAYPFLSTALKRDKIEAVIIRGISDRFNDKTEKDAEGSRPFALARAAAFLGYFLQQLKLAPAPAPTVIEEKAGSHRKKYRIAAALLALALFSWLLYPSGGPEPVPPISEAEAEGTAGIEPEISPPVSPTTERPDLENSPTTSYSSPPVTGPALPSIATPSPSEGTRSEVEETVTPPSSIPDTTASEIPALQTPKYLFRFDLFDREKEPIYRGSFNVDGKEIPASRGSQVELPAGEHELLLVLKGDTIRRSFYVHSEKGKRNVLFESF